MADHDESSDPRHDETTKRGLGAWRVGLLVISVVLMAGGVALPFVLTGEEAAPATPAEVVAEGVLPDGLVPEGVVVPFDVLGQGEGERLPGGESAAGDMAVSDDWAPVVFRLGFSFFVGFAIAFAVRRFLRIAIAFAGFVLLLLFGLQYAQIIDVNWQIFESHYDTGASWLRTQTTSFTAFVRGYLPSSALAALGILVGFKS